MGTVQDVPFLIGDQALDNKLAENPQSGKAGFHTNHSTPVPAHVSTRIYDITTILMAIK